MTEFEIEEVKFVIIHCTDTSANDSLCVDDIRHWHLARGFEDIGYHYVIKTNGEIQVGRDLAYQGAHAFGYNNTSVGICYIGGRDDLGRLADTRTFAQKISIAYTLAFLKRLYFPNLTTVLGHNDVSVKACPCFDAKKEYRDFYNKLKV